MAEEKRKRGRPKGSGKKKEIIPIPTQEKAVLLNGPIFDSGRIQKRINELINHEPLPFKEVPYPSNWNELSKVAKLQWLTENRLK